MQYHHLTKVPCFGMCTDKLLEKLAWGEREERGVVPSLTSLVANGGDMFLE